LFDDPPVCQENTAAAKVCDDSSGWKAMALAAVDRSAGLCEALWGRTDDEVLLYLADRFGLDPFPFDVLHIYPHKTLQNLFFTECHY